jgi:hypothetical protein
MIDLAAAYRRVDALLTQAGLQNVSYHVTVHAWNYRHGDGAAAVSFDIAAIVTLAAVVGVHSESTLDAALTKFEAELSRHLTSAEGRPGPDLHVALPGADGGVVEQAAAEIAEAADAASQPF